MRKPKRKQNLLEKLIGIVFMKPGFTAKSYVDDFTNSEFIVDKHSLNVILYGETEIFDPNFDERKWPRWRLTKGFLKEFGNDMSQFVDNDGQELETEIETQLSYIWPQELKLYKWQKDALQSWAQNNYIGAIQAVTGAGKTRLALAAIDVHIQDGYKVVVIVPTKELQRQWCDRIMSDIVLLLKRKYIIGKLGDGSNDSLDACDILVAIINSAYKKDLLPKKYRGLFIADECHHYGSEEWSKVLQSRFSRRLALSATLERDDDGNTKYIEPYFNNVCFDLDYSRALSEGVISNFRITMIGVNLGESEFNEYKVYEDRCKSNRRKLIENFDVPEEPFGEFMKQVIHLQTLGVPEAIRYISNFTKKRELVANSNLKQVAMGYLTKFVEESDKAIVFTQTKKSAYKTADNFGKQGISCQAITSDEGSYDRKVRMDAFKNGECKVIVGPKLLDEGIDVPDASLGIIIGASNSERQMRQRMGRILRKTEGKYLAELIIVYAKGTFEDPRNGAHEAFLDTIEDALSEKYEFDLELSSIDNACMDIVEQLWDKYDDYTYTNEDAYNKSINEAIESFWYVRDQLDENKKYV